MKNIGKRKEIDVDDDDQVDRFNELFFEVCDRFNLHKEISEVSYAQAAEILGVSQITVQQYVLGDPPLLRHGEGRGMVSFDDVIQRMMLVRKHSLKEKECQR